MSNPNSALYWLLALACCWPSPTGILLGLLVTYLWRHRIIRIDRSQIPSLGRHNNAQPPL
jgi:hypothetical protein